jgi:hypothetical protein
MFKVRTMIQCKIQPSDTFSNKVREHVNDDWKDFWQPLIALFADRVATDKRCSR